MACQLSESQVEALYKMVFGQIIADKNKKAKFDPDAYMRNLYTKILEKTKDEANAIDYIQHVPSMIILASANSTMVADYFLDNNIDVNSIYRQRRDFDDVNNVIKFLGINTNQELETVKELLDEKKQDITSTDPDTYEQVESSDPGIKAEAYKSVFYIDPTTGVFIAKPESALSTIGQEAKDYDGFAVKDNIKDDDPKKMTYYKVVRRVNDMIPLSGNADNIQLGSVKGIFLKAIVASQIPFADLYTSDQRYLSTDDDKSLKRGKTSQQKMESRESGKEILLVYTDKEGNILYFDSEGYPTTKEAGGTLAYTKIRTVLENEYGRFVKSVQQKEEIRLKRGLADFTEVTAERNYQIQIIDNTRSYLEKNPGSSLLFSIEAGRNGHIREDFDKRTIISKINLESGFNPTYAFQNEGITQSGGVYFMTKDYDFPVLILRPRFSEIGGLTDALTKMMFDSAIDDKKKVEVMQQFVNSKKTVVKIQNGSINITHAGTTIDLSNPSNRQAFTDMINSMKVNIKVNKINSTFELPVVNEKGEVTLTSQNYNNFLSDNFYTHLEVNAENKLIKLNAYNVIAPTKATSEILIPKEKVTGAKPESTLESETPSDQSIDQFMDKLNNFPTGLKKIAAIPSTATAEQIKEAERWWKTSPLSRYVELNVLLNVVNSDAVAEFTLSGIYLFKGSNFTDIYHESWHAFSQLFLTKPDKKKLYGEVRNLTGTFKTRSGKTVSFAKATDIQLEEFMAEDFRKFSLSKGTLMIDGRPVRNSIFKRIWNFLKALFKGYSIKQILLNNKAEGVIAEMYNKLYIGNINEYKPSINNVQFTQLFKGIQKVNASETIADGLNYQESMEVVQTIDSLMASNLAASTQSIGVLFTRPEIMDLMYKIVYNNIVKLEQKATDPEVKRILKFTLDHWGDYDKVMKGEQEDGVIAFHKRKSDLLTYEEKYEQLNPEDIDDDYSTNQEDVSSFEEESLKKKDKQLEEQFGSKVGDKKGNEISVRELASKQTVYLVSTLPQMDRNGKVVMNRLGAPKLVDLSKTWGIIINTIAGSKNKTEMYNKLVQNAKLFSNLKSLVEEYEIDGVKYKPRLGNPAERVQKSDYEYYTMWTAFFSDFSVYRIPIEEVQVIRETKLEENERTGKKEFKPTGKFEVRFVESAPLFQQVANNFTALFQTLQVGPLAKFITKSSKNTNILNYKEVIKTFDSPGKFIDVNVSLDFLRSVGIYMTDNPLIRQELNKPDIRSRIITIYDAFKRLANDKSKNVTIENPIGWLKSYAGQNSGNVDVLLNIEGRLSSNYSNNSIQNVDGNLEYDLSLNNSITQQFKELNSNDDYLELIKLPHMAHLNIETNPHAKYGRLLGSLYDLDVRYKQVSYSNKNKRKVKDNKTNEPVRIHIVNMNGVRSIDNEINNGIETKKAAGGIKTASLDGNSKFLYDLHTMLEKGVVELTRRSSKSSAFAVFVDSINTPYNTNDKTSYIDVGMFGDPIASTNAAVDLMMEKIAAEMERIAILKEDIENDGELSKITGFSQRGLSFSIFDDILEEDLQKELIDVANSTDSWSVINTPEFKERIHNSIASYLEKLYKENKDFYDEMPFLSSKLKDKIKKLTKKDGLTNSELEEIALRWFGFNYIFHNMEILALIDGDLAMFDSEKQEYNKRNPYVTSTGRVFSTDESDIKFINNLMNAEGSISYAKKINAPAYNFTTIINTAVFRDVDVKSAYFDSYVKFLVKSGKYTKEEAEKTLNAYTKMTEGDGQGWITFDMYRILSIIDNKWGPKQNELYTKIINDEEVDPDEITEFFPPRKFQYGGPLKTSRLHIPGFHKFSLAPLIPSVIKGTNLEILHDNLTMQGFGYGLFGSGSKLGTLTKDGKPDVFYENDDFSLRQIKRWKPGDPTYTPNPIFIQYLKNQTEVSSEWKKKTVFPTQLRKLIINDLFNEGIAIDSDIKKIVDDLQQQLNDLQSFKKQELLEEIGWILDENGKPTGDVDKLLVFVKKELARQGAPDHVIDFIDVDGTGKRVRYDLSLSLNAEQIEKILNAIVVKRLIRQKVKGEQLVQISGAGYESRSRFRKATEEEELKYKGTNDLPTYRPGKGKNGATTATKIKIAMKGDYYKLLELNEIKELAKKNNIPPLKALNILIRDEKWLDKGDNRKLVTLVGVRIPVQGLNSMEFMEVYEFLPEEAGNILIPPAEIVAKSGGDFDIDKLFILEPNYDNKPYASYAGGDNVKGTSNKIIESIRKILEHPKNFDTLIRPNDTDLVKPVAEDLAKKNLQGYNLLDYKMNTPKKNKQGSVIMSPTRFIEPRYNAYKHEVFNIAKRTLGIGAVDNAYSSVFKQINAFLKDTYTSHRDQPKKKHTRRVHILMDHNTINIDGKEYISLAKLTTQEKQKISDLISQLMNGWLDIEKDSWIFDVNGNTMAGPVLLFLIESGVNFRTAAYFVSQPLIMKYIKERYRAESPFYEAAGMGLRQGKGLNKHQARVKMIRDYIDPGIEDFIKAKDLYKVYMEGGLPASTRFTQENLLKSIESNQIDNETSQLALLHFFELEDIMGNLTTVKLNVNVDTSPSRSFFDAQNRLIKIQGLQDIDIFDSDLLNRIKTKTPLSSFFIQDFQLNLFAPLMPMRANRIVNDFIVEKIKDGTYAQAFDNVEKFQAAFKNDMPLYLLQNYIKGADLDTMKEYQGITMESAVPIQKVPLLRNGAFYDAEKGVMYVDKEKIKKDFEEKAFASDEYKTLGLYQLDSQTFASFPSNTSIQEYVNFVLEREYLRNVVPTEGKSREEYEKEIAIKALENTFNFYHMLKSSDSLANVFLQLRDNPAYKSVKDQYAIFDMIGPSNTKGDKTIKNLRLNSLKMDKDMVNVLHENLVRLSDIGTVKINDPVRNEKLSQFFTKLIVAEYLRAGTTKSVDSLASILPPGTLTKLLIDKMQDFKITKDFLEKYYSLFLQNWSTRARSKQMSNKIRFYLNPDVDIKPLEDDVAPFEIVEDPYTGVSLYTRYQNASSIKEQLARNTGVAFVIPINEDNITEKDVTAYREGNSVGVYVKKKGGGIAWTDETYDSNIALINKSIEDIQNKISDGYQVVFPLNGLVSVADKKIDNILSKAPRTFEYLVTELYKNFGYRHPGANEIIGFREAVQSEQEITDDQVSEFIKKCFG